MEIVYNFRRYRSGAAVLLALFLDKLGVRYRNYVEFTLTRAQPESRPEARRMDFLLPEAKLGLIVVRSVEDRAGLDAAGYQLALPDGCDRLVILPAEGLLPRVADDLVGDTGFTVLFEGSGCDYGHSWCRCSACGLLGIEYGGRSHRLPCQCYKPDDAGCDPNSTEILAAALEARAIYKLRYSGYGAVT